MSEDAAKILATALSLPAIEHAAIAEELLWSLDRPDNEIDAIWAGEAERRLAMYEAGGVESVSEEEVFAEYEC